MITNKINNVKTTATDVQTFPAVSSQPISVPLTWYASFVHSTGYARSCFGNGLLGKQKKLSYCFLSNKKTEVLLGTVKIQLV